MENWLDRMKDKKGNIDRKCIVRKRERERERERKKEREREDCDIVESSLTGEAGTRPNKVIMIKCGFS